MISSAVVALIPRKSAALAMSVESCLPLVLCGCAEVYIVLLGCPSFQAASGCFSHSAFPSLETRHALLPTDLHLLA